MGSMKRVRMDFASPRVAFGTSWVSADDPEWGARAYTGPVVALSFPRQPFRIQVPGRTHSVAHPGRVLLARPDCEYRRERLGPAGEVSDWIWFERATLEEHLGELEELWSTARWNAALDGPTWLAVRRLVHPRSEAPPAAVEAQALELLQPLAGALRDGVPAHPARGGRARRLAHDAIEYLLEHRAEPLQLPRLAHAVGLTPSHLCVVFKAATGRTLSSYLRHLRLCASLEHIARPGVRLSSLARELGFSSPSHFAARFRAEFGLTPSEAARQIARRPARERPTALRPRRAPLR